MRKILSFSILILLWINGQAQGGGLSYNLVVGKTYGLSCSSHTEVVQHAVGTERRISITDNYRLNFKVSKFFNDDYSLEVSYAALEMKTGFNGTFVNMNSQSKDPADFRSQVIAHMINKPFYVVMHKSGEIVSVQGIDKLVQQAFDQTKGIDERSRETFRKQLMENLSSNTIRSTLALLTDIYPAGKEANAWNKANKLEGVVKRDISTAYQLKGMVNGARHIIGNGEIRTNDRMDNFGETKVNLNLRGNISKDILVDPTSGWIKVFTSKQVIKGNIYIESSDASVGKVTVPVTYVINFEAKG